MQGVKLNSSILKSGKLVYFQNLVDLYLTQAYNAIPALSMIHANDKCVGVNHGTFEGKSVTCLELHRKSQIAPQM